ncbi:MAG: alpha/beta fold hydrolase [Acidimicrobiales bacterium]
MASSPVLVVTHDRSEVVVHDLGGSGDPLVMAHATGLHGRAFGPLAECLGDRFHSFAIDHRAHGDSKATESWAGDWRGFADDVLSAVRALGLGAPVGFGHSSGGAAMLLAEEAEPQTFSSLYCFEPIVRPDDESPGPSYENPLSAAALRRRESFDSFDAAVASFRTKPAFSKLHPQALTAYVKDGFEQLADGSVRLKCRPADEARVYAYANSHRAYTRLGDVTCPVTLARGSESEFIDAQVIETLALRLRFRRIEVIPGVGHLGPLERPDLVAESMIRSLVDDPPGRGLD